MNNDLPQLDNECFQIPDTTKLFPAQRSTHAPRILLLYGSLRERSFSRLMAEEAARL
jgi:arsenic resistance protein ArsH